jgi:hypothetical protein
VDALRRLSALWSALSAEVLDNVPAGMNGEDKYNAICAMMVCAIYRTPELIKTQEVVRIYHEGR